jgi:hypothetical protein
MAISDTAKGATALCSERPSNIEQLGGRLENSDTSSRPALQLRCDLVGNDGAIAGDIMARGPLDMCRRLLAAGADPATELLCYRNGQSALRIRSIGDGARLVVRETATDGPRFVTWKAFPRRAVEAPVRLNRKPAFGQPGTADLTAGAA